MNFSAKFVAADPLPEGIYHPLCLHYDLEQRLCGKHSSVRITVKIAYDHCCLRAPECVCGIYADLHLCEIHALQVNGKERKDETGRPDSSNQQSKQ